MLVLDGGIKTTGNEVQVGTSVVVEEAAGDVEALEWIGLRDFSGLEQGNRLTRVLGGFGIQVLTARP